MTNADPKPRLVKMGTAATSTRWRPVLEVGVKEIDQQHKTLIARATAVQEAMAARKPKEEVATLLGSLVEVVASHFAWEERLMESRGFKDFAHHRKSHSVLLDQIRGLHEEFLSGSTSPSDGLGLFIQVWAENHIAGTDNKLAEFILKTNESRKKSLRKTS